MMPKKKTINVKDIWSVKGRSPSDEQNQLTFENDKYKINIHFSAFVVDYIAAELWEIIKERQRRLRINEQSMKGEEQKYGKITL